MRITKDYGLTASKLEHDLHQVDYKRDGVVSNIVVLASSVEEALEKARKELEEEE